MTVIATALKHMLAAGMPHDAIIAAVAEMEASVVTAERPRSKGADRQARYMERKRHKASQSVIDDAADVSGDEKRHSDPLPLPPNDNNSNPPTPAPENNSRVREAADSHVTDWQAWRVQNPFPRPHWADPQPWADFLKNRKAKKRPNTMTAHDRLLSDMTKVCARTGWPPGKVFRACVEQGWAGIYETDEMKEAISGPQLRKPHGRPRDRGPDPILDALARATAEAEALERAPADPAGDFGTGHALPAQRFGGH